MKTVRIFIIMMSIFLSFARFAAAEDNSDQSRKRLDDLFRWRVSDTLQLDTKQDAQFTAILDRVHEKRRKAGEEMSRIVGEIEQTEDKKKIESLITQYQKQMKVYGETQTEELNELRKVFGTVKLGRYLVFKNELGRKLKSALSSAKPGDENGPSVVRGSPLFGNAPQSKSGTDLDKTKPDADAKAKLEKEKIPEPSIIDHE